MHTLEEIRRALAGCRLEEVAAETGLSYATIRRYRLGAVENPPFETVRRLSSWIDNRGRVAEVGS